MSLFSGISSEDVARVVAESRSLAQVLTSLAFNPRSTYHRSQLKKHLLENNVDTTHFTSGKLSWTPGQLDDAVRSSESVSGVLRKMGLTVCPGNRRTIQKYIAVYQCDTSHFTGQAWAASEGSRHPSKKSLEEILTVDSTYPTHTLRQRLISEGVREARCERCGLSEWQEEPIQLELDHINGIKNDHRDENLRVLCCNCHALTDTWRWRNRGRIKLELDSK